MQYLEHILRKLADQPRSHLRYQKQPVLDLTPTRARAPALYVMGGWQWLLGDACALMRTRVPATPRYRVWASWG